MSDLSKVLAQWQSAETSDFEVAEIKGVQAAEEGTAEVTLLVKERDDDATPNESDTAEQECQEPEETDEDEGTRENSGADEETADTSDGDASWNVNGREFGYNELQQAVSEADIPYPDDTSGDGLAEALMKAATLENTENQADETDTGNESDTKDDIQWPDAEYLRQNGVEEKYISDVQEYAEKGCSECAEDDCAYAANGENAEKCAGCQNDDESGGDNGDNNQSGSAPADDVEQVSDLFDVSMTVAEAVVFRVSKGDFDSHREAVEELA